MEVDLEGPSPLVVRVGAIYYDDSAAQYHRIQAILSAMGRKDRSNNESNRPISFKLVVGTYDEVYHWFRSDQIDLAIMNPGPLALLLEEYGADHLNKGFIGIRGLEPEPTSMASTEGKKPRSEYNSMMLVNWDAVKDQLENPSKKRTLSAVENQKLIDFVVARARQKQVHFLFVHPFSTSGYIFPRRLLKQFEIDLDPTDYDLTYSHSVSTKEVSDSGLDENGRLNVAFVSDETDNILNQDKVLAIRSGPLSTKIVQDALILTPDFVLRESGEVERLKALLRSDGPETFHLVNSNAKWWERYDEVGSWIGAFNDGKPLMSNEVTIDQIIRRVNNYNLHHPEKPARVALVLSGGGAKCAYQLGAVEVIEDKFQQAQKANRTEMPRIDLVVGTSGGAINALTIAAGVTQDDRRKNLRSTWESFGQSEILKPSDMVQRLFGLGLGLNLSLVFVFVLNLGWTRRRVRKLLGIGSGLHFAPARKVFEWISKLTWAEGTGIVLLILALALYLIGQKEITLTSQLDPETLLRQHLLIHIVEYSGQSVRWAAVPVLIFGAFLVSDLILSSRLPGYSDFSRKLRPPALVLAIALALILPFATLYTTLILEDSLFVSSGIEEKMAVEIPQLFASDVHSGDLTEISRNIIKNNLIKRDLVITGSILQTHSNSNHEDGSPRVTPDDADLYFIYKVGESPDLPEKLRKDNRFVSLRDPANESILLDAVIGSGSIFPAFKPKLSRVKRVMDKTVTEGVSIIDGGFVHNSPIEAAVKLDATHIILIEASPEYRPSENVNFATNTVAAFNHLFTQAQLLDARSRREAEIFTLQPDGLSPNGTPFLCTLDFGINYIREAMRWGAEDAANRKRPRFVRQPRPSGF
jgi:predicted acylesterase/phospholipase RssA